MRSWNLTIHRCISSGDTVFTESKDLPLEKIDKPVGDNCGTTLNVESSSEIQPKSGASSSYIDQYSNTADNYVKKTGRNSKKRRWHTDNKTDLQGSSAKKQSGPIQIRPVRLKRTRHSDDEDELDLCSAKKLKPEQPKLPIRRDAEKVMIMRYTMVPPKNRRHL